MTESRDLRMCVCVREREREREGRERGRRVREMWIVVNFGRLFSPFLSL